MKRILSLLTAALAVVLSLALCDPSWVRAQAGFGAASIILSAPGSTPLIPQTVTLAPPVNPSAEFSAWSTAGFPALTWSVPIPPANHAQGGFIYAGPLSGGVIPQIAYWLPPGQSSISGSGNVGGYAGAWDYASATQLGLAASLSGTANTLAKFNGTGTTVINSLLTDNGATLNYNGVFTVNAGTGAVTSGGLLTASNALTVSAGQTTYSYGTVPAGAAIAIPNNTSVVTVTDDAAAAANIVTMPAGANGQILFIYNADSQSLNGAVGIPSGQPAQFLFVNGAWHLIHVGP